MFHRWLSNRYADTYVNVLSSYCKRYYNLISGDLKTIDMFSLSVKNNTIKSLIVLSKFLGLHKQFKERLDNYGLKTSRPDSLDSFLRILKASDSDVLLWLKDANSILRDNEKLYLRYALVSGLRKEEAIKSFNLIIQLSKENKILEYYDKSLSCLCHFKYPKLFIRHTKNTFITFITEDLLSEIANSKPLTYAMIYRRLNRHKIKCRINELRDFFNTYMLKHGILEQEINLLCGRIPPSIFIKHYWSPKLSELGNRVFKAISELEKQIS
jgi:intergrase/recombinase